jgi:hypothetical protein
MPIETKMAARDDPSKVTEFIVVADCDLIMRFGSASRPRSRYSRRSSTSFSGVTRELPGNEIFVVLHCTFAVRSGS